MHEIPCCFTDLNFTNFIEDHHCLIGDRGWWIMSVVFISKATSNGYSFSGFILHSPDRVCCWLSLVASCSHVILYFAVLCRMCGNVEIKHYICSEMDLRPFNSLGQYLNGFTSKKDFSVTYQDLILKMDFSSDWNFYLQLWSFSSLRQENLQICRCFPECSKVLQTKKLFLF